MADGKLPGLDIEFVQNVADGTLCKAPSGSPGIIGRLGHSAPSLVSITSPSAFVYCHAWSGADRKAFWTGFLGRAEEFGKEFEGYFVWFCDAFGVGDEAGDFEKAWSNFGSTIGHMGELGWKMAVVAGMPPVMVFHPQRIAYSHELATLGLTISKQVLDGYKKAYAAGGVPQCTGVLLADLLRLVFEILGTKGLAAGTKAIAASRLATKLQGALGKIPKMLKKPPNRNQLISYIQHSDDAALYGRGILTDLKSGQFLIRVEGAHATRPGNWFVGPFRTLDEAKKHAQYLAAMGKKGIRRDKGLPQHWFGGKDGNPVDVLRIYEVNHPTPAISSVVAPQLERGGGKMMVTPEHRAALKKPGDKIENLRQELEYPGGGQQLSLPVYQTSKIHEIDLVKRVSGAEIRVSKP